MILGINFNNDFFMLILDFSGMILSENFGSNRLCFWDVFGVIGSQWFVMNGFSICSIFECQLLGLNGDWGEGMVGFVVCGWVNGYM